MVLTFFTGLSLEQNLKSSRTNTGRKVDNLMRVLRRLQLADNEGDLVLNP